MTILLMFTLQLFTLTKGIQYVRIGDGFQNNIPITETLDTEDNTICQAPQSFYDFTANHHGDADLKFY